MKWRGSVLDWLFEDEDLPPQARWTPFVPPVVPVARLVEGTAAIRGRVLVAEKTTPSVIDDARVVAEVLRLHSSAEDAAHAQSVPFLDHCAACDFLVEDETGRVLVRVAGSKLVLEPDGTTVLTNDLPVALLERLPEHTRVQWQDSFVAHASRHLLQPGDEVLVVGEARFEAGEGYRGLGRRLAIGAPARGEMLVVDAALEKRLRRGVVPSTFAQRAE